MPVVSTLMTQNSAVISGTFASIVDVRIASVVDDRIRATSCLAASTVAAWRREHDDRGEAPRNRPYNTARVGSRVPVSASRQQRRLGVGVTDPPRRRRAAADRHCDVFSESLATYQLKRSSSPIAE